MTLITEQSLDADYEVVAARGPSQAPPGRRRTVIATVVALAGILGTIAFVQTSRSAALQRTDKDDLIARVTAAKAALNDEGRRLSLLQASTSSATNAYGRVDGQWRAALGDLNNLGAQAGSAPVSGTGIQVTVTDGGSSGGQVQDSDLRALVNALWIAGAKAISINGERLSTRSAMRNSGSVIRLNGVSLSSPYVVTAVGPAVGTWSATVSGGTFRSGASTFGFTYSEAYPGSVTVPAGSSGMLTLSYAKPSGKDQQ
ncbi:DUF881 domain-containing protein [Nocardioides baekrokdamisoli]|uniref:DUF881 domain-containing protein n=1 Tax=Nocardioides baekrokdamisoli TaxID=1804624 RepID=UPI0013DE25B0|nr:DUF881 domain-containing protein [Nocardioides baekrokdamisoli]